MRARNIVIIFIAGFLVIMCFAVIPAAAETRPVSITTEPNAVVWIDGVRYGKTDESGKLAVTTFSTGKHTIRVRADGFKEVSQPLPAGQKGEIKIALSAKADEAELAYQKAEALAATDRELAAAAYMNAIRLRPKYPEAYIGLARIYSETGDIDKAEKAVRDARRVRPAYAEASAIEGRIFTNGGDDPKAVAAFKRAIAEGKGYQPEAYTGLGLLYKAKAEGFGGSGNYEEESKNYSEAARYLAIAAKQLAGSPDSVVVHQLLGLIYEQQKKYKEAIAVYEEFLRLFPESAEASAVQSFIVQLRKQMYGPK